MQDLDGLQPERLDAVEDPLAGAEQDRRDVERELVDDPCNEGLAHGRGATRDVYAALAGRLTRLCVSGVEAVERDRHVAGGVRHRRPPKVVAICKWRLASGDSTLVQATHPQTDHRLSAHPRSIDSWAGCADSPGRTARARAPCSRGGTQGP